MIDLVLMFGFLLMIFGIIGYLRGWQKEVIAMAGLVAAMAALSQFAYVGAQALGMIAPEGAPFEAVQAAQRQQFWLQAVFVSILAFFSYQMVGRIADLLTRGRFGDRLRSGLETRITGTLFGLLNGYLYVGALWGFLEYLLIPGGGYQRLPEGAPYPFDVTIITRPAADTLSYAVASWLPQNFSATFWLIAFFVVFFVVIIALI